MSRSGPGLLLFAFLLLLSAAAPAEIRKDQDTLFVYTSVYTKHFDPTPDHVNRQNALAIEYNRARGWLVGGGYFDNSFGQPSQYLYVGKKFVLSQVSRHLYGKLTGGLVHGYKGKHKDAIPFNNYGVAPAALPSLGLQFGHFGTELILFGTSGLLVTVGWNFGLGSRKSE